MKRDLELVRLILKAVEDCPSWAGLMEIPAIESHEPAAVSYHIQLLRESGLLVAEDSGEFGHGYREWQNINLTWAGHEFLDATKDDTAWMKVKEKAIRPGMSFTFDVVKKILEQMALQSAQGWIRA